MGTGATYVRTTPRTRNVHGDGDRDGDGDGDGDGVRSVSCRCFSFHRNEGGFDFFGTDGSTLKSRCAAKGKRGLAGSRVQCGEVRCDEERS